MGDVVHFAAMEDIEVIETEWGSELHKRLIAEKHAARVAYRNSPEAWEEARLMKEAEPLTIDWTLALKPKSPTKKVPIYRWNAMSV